METDYNLVLNDLRILEDDMKTLKNIAVSAALAVAMAGSMLAGCGTDGKATAIVVNGEELNVGTANFILRYQQAQTYSMAVSYGFVSSGQSLWDTEINSDSESTSSESVSTSSSSSSSESVSGSSAASSSESVSGSSAASSSESVSESSSSSASSEETSSSSSEESYSTYGEEFKDATVLPLIENMMVTEQHLSDYDVSLSDDQKNKIQEIAASTYKNNKSTLKKMGTTQEDVEHAIELMSYEYLIRPKLNEEVDQNVSDEEAAQTSFTYARFSETQTDSTTGTTSEIDEATKAQYQSEAESIISKIKESGDVANCDISSIAEEVDSENAASLTGSYGKDDTTYPDEVKNALNSLSDGQLYDGVIDAGGYLWVVRLDKKFDEEQTQTEKESIISQRESDHYDEVMQEWVDEADITVEEGWDKLEVTDQEQYNALAASSTSSSSTSSSASESTSSSSATSSSVTESTSSSSATSSSASESTSSSSASGSSAADSTSSTSAG
jgi:foldase protein PrsA